MSFRLKSTPFCPSLPTGSLWVPSSATTTSINYYEVLNVQPDASAAELKAAYHKALLRHHPDKQATQRSAEIGIVEIAHIKEAFEVLSNSSRRAEHDAELKRASYAHRPRPAQVIPLEEWTSLAANGSEDEGDEGPWTYPCRCGGRYTLTLELMERDEHLIGCDSCSEVVWAGYEAQQDSDDEG
ncbi:hypothetical protein CC1G_00580 [Coprinopsis cinerea okayama7|uniref:Diphthamide biosynthesis protein 4 n=1 Tax=Coprinopsis cinerea (strain Okayama-7 / 130 / ATCC MYA-4618 / FGSC 9003) TaxID=240176 RepID=A8N3W8_COPC7|nr:hypothetical protein CC1G_00580 [Coprinopsis cinerea okayama7\|eukprot:XP_001829401.1 hypothetical protein CC1G_00580 [Coprinopsis cinerea okayama7\